MTENSDFRYDSAAEWLEFDEAFGSDQNARSHWLAFFDQLGATDLGEIARRWEEAKDLIRENGVTYNVYGDPRGMERPWELDPIPLLVAPKDAATLEMGLIQRARLLDRILADLYGPRIALNQGVLPPELVFGNSGFLRSCYELRVPNNRYLYLYAADLGRSANGTFVVLRDRAQAPSGAGYALENRIVMSRMLPEAFRDCRVQRLALFFRTLRESLRAAAPSSGNRENPRIVLLTPGPYNETYFEHAFLARYLGYTLAEGGDLTVRDNRVYLKLLGGLQRVDVVLRRLDDDYCDPLELRGASYLGVPGLAQAARSGHVVVANALGSGAVESPALFAYLPALCRHFLGEELLIPSTPTWWCGDPQSLEHVIAHLSTMVIKPTFREVRSGSIFGEDLSGPQLRTLAETIRARPMNYVGQEYLQLSTAPIMRRNHLHPRRVMIRAFLTATSSSAGFSVMPGGLTRVAATDQTRVISMQSGGGSKDTWVLSSGPVHEISLLPSISQPIELVRDSGDLPSRAADDLFWLGRYAERAEGTARLLRGVIVRLAESSSRLADLPDLRPLLSAVTFATQTYPGFLGPDAESRIAAPEDELLSVIFDEFRTGSLAYTLSALRRVGGRARDRLSIDMWRIITSLNATSTESRAQRQGRGWTLAEALDVLDELVATLAAFGGLVMEGMTRGQGWRFLNIGRGLERSLHLISIVRAALTTFRSPESPFLEAILEIFDSIMTYRRRYLSSLQIVAVLDLVLADESNPRSLAFQLASISRMVEDLPQIGDGDRKRPFRFSALKRLQDADFRELTRIGPTGQRLDLDALLGDIETELTQLSESLSRAYLSHLQAARQFAGRAYSPSQPRF